MRNEKGVLAWHFCTEGRKLGYGDEREIRVGETLTVEGPVMLCDHGLHGSVKLLNALSYAPGCTVERVRIGGEVVHGDGKLVGTERTCLGIGDVRKELVVFAEWCARRARRAAAGASASAGGAVWAARASASAARAAGDAAGDAAGTAAWTAAGAAGPAGTAAGASARTAWAAAGGAASAAWAAGVVRTAVGAAERELQERVLERLIRKALFGGVRKGE